MERPDRVIIDLPEVAFHLPAEAGRSKEGLIASYRYGLFAPGRSRVVMELDAAGRRLRHDHGEPDATGAATILTIELSRTERERVPQGGCRERGRRRRQPRRRRRSRRPRMRGR